MAPLRLILLTLAALTAFAGNSILCRLALRQSAIDPASFTSLRILAGAITLWFILRFHGDEKRASGNWISAFALFAYAAAFSFAYVKLSAGTGALLLFAAVQATMILSGLSKGERLKAWQIAGLSLAVIGLVVLLLPGISAPPIWHSLLMVGAGIAWGVYSLRGRATIAPISATAGNFLRAVPMALLVSVIAIRRSHITAFGVMCALCSGAISSGIGYAIWYMALAELRAISAASVQLSVPVLTALIGIAFLGESLTARLILSTVTILAGIALVVLPARNPAPRAA